jgi:ketosteroid isomerase-like protein
MDIAQAFAALNGKFVDTVNSRDPAGWVALFADDAILVPADRPIVSGRKGLEQWADAASKIWNHLEISQGPCASNGDIAWETGSWTGNINLPDNETLDIGGYFLLVAQSDGDALRIKAHSWNVNSMTS